MKNILLILIVLLNQIIAVEETKYSPESRIGAPLFFEVSKDDQCFYMLPSSHEVPLRLIPLEIKSKILSCTTLVCERCTDGEEIYQQLRDIYYNEEHNWFDTLDAEEKNTLLEFFKIDTRLHKIFKWILPEFKIDIGIMKFILEQVAFSVGMDKEIYAAFENEGKKIIGLDEASHIIDGLQIFESKTAYHTINEVELLKKFMQCVKEHILSGQDRSEWYAEYLSGQCTTGCDDEPAFKEETERWEGKFFNTILPECAPEEIVCMVIGYRHCFGDFGFLKNAEKRGWSVKIFSQ